MPPAFSRKPLKAYITVALLLAVTMGLVYALGPYDDSSRLNYRLVQSSEDPPRQFDYILALEPPPPKLPSQEKLLAVVRHAADKSLMRIGSVQKWTINLSLPGAEEKHPFISYHWQDEGDQLQVEWHRENLPLSWRESAPKSGSTR